MFCLLSCGFNRDKGIPVNLRCEYIVNPLGVENPHPRLTWQLDDERMGAKQTSFRVFIGTDSTEVAEGGGNLWISDKINSGKNLITYSGNELKPSTRYYWGVRIWGRSGRHSDVSPVAFFETGKMETNNWTGTWIADSRDINLKPAPYFRKEFSPGKPVHSARVYIAVAGLYELYINGTKSGDAMLDPAYTRFDRRTLYVVHDVTSMLNDGNNAIGVILGNGWYNHQSTAVWFFHEAPWRARPNFCAELHITYTDGSQEVIPSGTDWKTSLSPVVFNSIYTAEHYDARLEQPGWNKPGFDDSKWKNSIAVSAPSQNITAQVMHPIRAVEEIQPKGMNRIDNRTWVFDLGRNISGVSSLTVSGESGTVIRMKHSERLDKSGRADQSNIDVHYRPTDDSDPFQTDIFILSGKGQETFRPRFNYKGFQFVEVTADNTVEINKESLKGYFMHSDVPPAGRIYSSDTLLNKIWHATNSSYLSNLFGYPTDCPQREKNGWTGDAHIASETGLYNFDAITVYEKWLRDHQDEQQPNGVLPAIIPTSGWGYHWANGPDWTSTIAIIPWNIYLFYGDPALLEQCYPNIKRYVDHIDAMSPSGLTDWGLGDWIPINSVTAKELTSSIYYYTDVLILSKAAGLLGKDEDREKYTALAVKIKDAVNSKYLNREKGIYGTGLQTEQCVPLYWGIVPDEMRQIVADNLAKSIMNNGGKMDVGLLGTKAILNALSENGYEDLAFELASRDKFPSWGWWIVNGATTLYENWPIDSKSDISMNHIMFGEIGAWMYKALGGMFPDEADPGFKNVILRPRFVKGLNHFEAEHEGPYGKIVSSWRKEDGHIVYDIIIPANSTATLLLKASGIVEGGKKLSSNKHIKTEKDKDGTFVLNLQSGKYSFSITEDSNEK
ncbi:MAG TPA: glycoside hydrolase family 78 protein [Bacteroidales bacterium]|nr:glycoside hydrolase family 78 protein [Bacteroidales bacterium]